jgi:hypothetical protein
VPVTVSIDSAVLNGDSLNVQVSGIPGFIITACGNASGIVRQVDISADIGGATASATIPEPSIDGYSASFTVNVSALFSGTYTLQVTAKSVGTDTTTAQITIPYFIRKILPLASGGTATFSQTMFGIGDSYSFSVSSAPHSVSGDLYKSTDGGSTWAETTGWIQTDSTGNGTNGPWTCNSANGTSVYIKWPDGTQTNTASYVCLPNPTISLTSSPSQINRSMGDPVTISWSSLNASQCAGTINLGGETTVNIGGTSGNYTVPAEQLTLNNTLLEGYPYPGTSSPQLAPINSSITCQNSVGKISSASASTNVFYNNVNWVGLKESSCGSVSSAVSLSSAEAQQVTLAEEIDNKRTGERVKFRQSATLQKIDNRVWGWGEPMIYKVANDASGNPVVTPPTGYVYCKNDGGSYTTLDSWPNTTSYTGDVNLYFAPVGGGAPGIPTNFDTVGECRQNYPDTQTQNSLSWSPVSGADSYNVYKDGVLLANTSNIWYLDIFSPAKYNESHNYYVTAKNSSGESAKTSTLTSTTPATCDEPPPPIPGSSPGYRIDPAQKTINVGDTAQFRGLYDPDGNNIRYGDFDVTSLASCSWSVVTQKIAQSLGSGKYLGNNSGSTGIGSVYRTISATASLNVINPPGTPDFSISINPATPQYNSVIEPGTATYVVTIYSSGGFSDNVALSIDSTYKLHSGTTGSFSPTLINTSGSSTLTLSVSKSAAVERYTFEVIGTSGSLSHSASADINITNGGGPSCTVYPNPQNGTSPLTTSVTASGSGGSSPYQYKYDWTSDGTYDTSYGSSPQSHTYNSNGTYKITAMVKDNNGTTATCDTSVNSGSCVGPTCNVCVGSSCGGGGTLSCTLDGNPKFGPASLGVSFQISNVSGGDGNYQYSFDYGDGGSTSYPASNPSNHSYINQGNYTATGSVKDGSENTGTCSNTIAIEVSPPTPSGCTFTASPSAVLYGQSSTLTWSCTPTDITRNCTITKVSDGSGVATGTQSGSVKVKPTQSTIYNLHCDKDPVVQDTTATVNVGFIPVIREIIPR